MTLLAFAAEPHAAAVPSSHLCRSISPACLAHSSKPALPQQWRAAPECLVGWTDGWMTDARHLHRPCSACYAGSANSVTQQKHIYNLITLVTIYFT